jgi:hypothetical protein
MGGRYIKCEPEIYESIFDMWPVINNLMEAIIMNVKLVCSGIFNIWPMIDGLTEAVIINANEFLQVYLICVL